MLYVLCLKTCFFVKNYIYLCYIKIKIMEKDIMGEYGYIEKYFVTEKTTEFKKTESKIQYTFDEKGNDIYYYEGVRYTPKELEIKLKSINY